MIRKEAIRFLRRDPLLNGVAVMLLSLGIGLSTLALTLLFSLSSLVPPGARWMNYATIAEETSGGGSAPISWKAFELLRETVNHGNLQLAAYTSANNALLGDGAEMRTITVSAVSSGFFSSFVQSMASGRDFDLAEESNGGHHAAILSVLMAKSLFGTPGAAVNQYIRINGLAFEVIGVAPENFDGLFGETVDAWVPANCVGPLFFNFSGNSGSLSANLWKIAPSFYVVAGSKMPSSTLFSILNQITSARSKDGAPLHISPGLTNDPVKDIKLRRWSRLGFLLALVFTFATGLNYAGLLLARTSQVLEEVRLRRTLGATTRRLLAQMIVGPAFSMTIALLAAFVLCLGALGFLARRSQYWQQVVRGGWHSAIASLVLQILLAATLTLFIALVPALRLLRDSGTPRLGYTSTQAGRALIVLKGIVALQMAFCMVACILAGSILCAVHEILHEPLGFNPDSLTATEIWPAGKGAETYVVNPDGPFPMASAISSILESVSAARGVRSASAALNVPLDRPMRSLMLQPVDNGSATERAVSFDTVTRNYFYTLGSRMVTGNTFSSGSLTGNVDEVVVNQALAREVWPNQSAVGRIVRMTAPVTGIVLTATVVGVTENIRFSGLTDAPHPTVFLPLRGVAFTLGLPYIVADGAMTPNELEKITDRRLASLRPAFRSREGYSIDARAKELMSRERSRAFWTIAGTWAIAMAACIGLYAMLSYVVSVRRRELAVRICFGASPWAIRRTILSQTFLCAAVATMLCIPVWPFLRGLASAEWLGQMVWSTQLAVYVSVACVVAALLLSLSPAAAATQVPPAEILRQQ